MKLVLGLGCDRGTGIETLERAVSEALQSAGLNFADVCCLATIDRKSDEQCLLALAERHGLPLHFYPATELAKVEVPSPSAVVMKYMGTPSVSEAAALLAANTTMAGLLVEKFKLRGEDGKNAKVSVARNRRAV